MLLWQRQSRIGFFFFHKNASPSLPPPPFLNILKLHRNMTWFNSTRKSKVLEAFRGEWGLKITVLAGKGQWRAESFFIQQPSVYRDTDLHFAGKMPQLLPRHTLVIQARSCFS